jgi:parallel beta-helix repeat protein
VNNTTFYLPEAPGVYLVTQTSDLDSNFTFNNVTTGYRHGLYVEADYWNISYNYINTTGTISSAVGLYLYGGSADNNTITYNNVTGGPSAANSDSIRVAGDGNTIMYNNFYVAEPGSRGIYFDTSGSEYNVVSYNTISGSNTDYPIYISSAASYNNISHNNASNNSYATAIKIDVTSVSNQIWDNYFNGSGNDDGTTTKWNITKTAGTNIIGGSNLGGNYWPVYTGYDSDSDGLGNVPYSLSGTAGAKDELPLTDRDACNVDAGEIITLVENLTCSSLNIAATGTLDTAGWNLTVTNYANASGTLHGRTGAHTFGSLTINSSGTYNATNGQSKIADFMSINGTFTYNSGSINISGTNTKFATASNVRLDKVTSPPADKAGYRNITYYVNITNLTPTGGFNSGFFNITYIGTELTDESVLKMWRHNGTEWVQTGINSTGVNTTDNYVWANITNFSSIYAPIDETTAVSMCRNLTQANTVYTLVNNLTGVQASDICIDIQADNITLNCSGHNLTGTGEGVGIYAENIVNADISNCEIINYSAGIKFDGTNTSNITDSTIRVSVANGVYIRNSVLNNVSNTVFDSNANGILLGLASENNTLFNNTIYNGGRGIWVMESGRNNLTNNTIYNQTFCGISLGNVSNNNIMLNNRLYNNTVQTDVQDVNSLNNTFINTTIGYGSIKVISSFTGFNYTLKQVELSERGADQTGYSNISKYLNLTNTSANAWISLNISYTDIPSSIWDNNTLRIWKNSSGKWWNAYATPEYVGNASQAGIDTINKYVYANISNFSSIFAPMGEKDPCNVVSSVTLSANLSCTTLNITSTGTLDTNGYNVSATSYTVINGTMHGRTGTHTLGPLTINSGGTYNASTGTNIFNGKVDVLNGGTFSSVSSAGTVWFNLNFTTNGSTYWKDSTIRFNGTFDCNLYFEAQDYANLTIDNSTISNSGSDTNTYNTYLHSGVNGVLNIED